MTTLSTNIGERPLGTAAVSGQTTSDTVKTRLPFLVKIYLVLVVLPVAFYVGPIFMTGLRGFLLLATLPLLAGLFMGRYGRVNLLDIMLLVHLFWMLLSFAITAPQALAGVQGAVTIEALGGYLLARAYINSRERFIALCKFVGLLAAALLPLALYETVTANPILISFIRSLPGITSVEIVYIERRLGLDRVQAVFAHPIHFGLFCSVAFSLTFVALKDEIAKFRRLLTSAAVALCTFLALSSGAILAMVLQLFLIAWYATLRNMQGRWWLLFGLFVVMYIAIDIGSTRSPIKVFMSYATFSPGTAYWRGLIFEWGIKNVLGDAENNIPGAPLFGIGMADWIRPVWMGTPSVDNFWLALAMRHGVPGFLTLAIGWFWLMFKLGGRRDMDDDVQYLNLRRAWMFTFTGLSFTLCTVYIWTNIYSFVMFMLAAGVWMLSALPRTPDGDDDEPEEQAPTGVQYSRFGPQDSAQRRPPARTGRSGGAVMARTGPQPVHSKR